MDATSKSVNKNDGKKSFVTKAQDKHTSETYITGLYTPICFHTL